MINANEVKSLIPAGGSLLLNFVVTAEGKLTVVVHPKYPEQKSVLGANDAIEKAKQSPVVVTAAAEELDANFMVLLTKISEKKNSFEDAMKTLEKDTDEAIKQAKLAAEKKIAETKKTTGKIKTVSSAAVVGSSSSVSGTAEEECVDPAGTVGKVATLF